MDIETRVRMTKHMLGATLSPYEPASLPDSEMPPGVEPVRRTPAHLGHEPRKEVRRGRR